MSVNIGKIFVESSFSILAGNFSGPDALPVFRLFSCLRTPSDDIDNRSMLGNFASGIEGMVFL